MKAVIIKNVDEYDEALTQAEKEGLKMAAASNTGLPHGHLRITFLPSSAFKK